jgi:hypothetical protein
MSASCLALPSKPVQIETVAHPGGLNCGAHVQLYALLEDGSIYVKYIDSGGYANTPDPQIWYLV